MHSMKRVEIKAKEGYALTQVADVPMEERIYVSKVNTPTPEKWKEAPTSERDAWRKEMDKLRPIIINSKDSLKRSE